jgi:hypothetical protein
MKASQKWKIERILYLSSYSNKLLVCYFFLNSYLISEILSYSYLSIHLIKFLLFFFCSCCIHIKIQLEKFMKIILNLIN